METNKDWQILEAISTLIVNSNPQIPVDIKRLMDVLHGPIIWQYAIQKSETGNTSVAIELTRSHVLYHMIYENNTVTIKTLHDPFPATEVDYVTSKVHGRVDLR